MRLFHREEVTITPAGAEVNLVTQEGIQRDHGRCDICGSAQLVTMIPSQESRSYWQTWLHAFQYPSDLLPGSGATFKALLLCFAGGSFAHVLWFLLRGSIYENKRVRLKFHRVFILAGS